MKTNKKISEQKMQEFRDKMMNYNNWRWSGVSLYQGIFIAFITASIVLSLDIIAKQDLTLKLLILALLIFVSYKLYTKMLKQTQKPIFVAENMIGTLEGEPKLIKDKKGKGYYIMNISGVHHKDVSKK